MVNSQAGSMVVTCRGSTVAAAAVAAIVAAIVATGCPQLQLICFY